VLDVVMQPGFLERVTRMGQHLTRQLQALSQRHGCGEVRGRGLLQALDLKRNIAPAVAQGSMERGLLLNAPRPDTLRFMPALTVTEAEIDRMAVLLDSVLMSVVT
jgi:acetylornithine/N-succinyldiaminopimelate aminotransferase